MFKKDALEVAHVDDQASRTSAAAVPDRDQLDEPRDRELSANLLAVLDMPQGRLTPGLVFALLVHDRRAPSSVSGSRAAQLNGIPGKVRKSGRDISTSDQRNQSHNKLHPTANNN